MVFAAGLGTRLRPLTDTVPKALVTVCGMTILERAIRHILPLEPGSIVVNAHHHASQVETEVARLNATLMMDQSGGRDARGGDGPRIVMSLEVDRPLETGGGLRQARRLLDSGRPVLLHNGDVITQLDLASLVSAHAENIHDGRTIATLAVQRRASSRELLFDEEGLYGRRYVESGREELARSAIGDTLAVAFSGIHLIEPRLLATLPERDVFSITDHYLALAGQGIRIRPFDMASAGWWEIGSAERLAEARRACGDAEGDS